MRERGHLLWATYKANHEASGEENWDVASSPCPKTATAEEIEKWLTERIAIRLHLPKNIIIILTALFGAAAALAEFPVGEGRETVTICPAADDMKEVRRALAAGGTVVLMKIGKRLPEVVAAADKEERCALLPLVSASLLLTVNSPLT